MRLNFLDIGTSDFDIGDNENDLQNKQIDYSKNYLLVEPLQSYLDNIPTAPNIIKANYAISNINGEIDIYYIKQEDIIKYQLPNWVRGCNKINENHPTIIKLLQQHNLSLDIITCKKVKCITFNALRQLYNITHVENLKIDTEGHDHIILEEVLKCVLENTISIDKIKLEYLPDYANIAEIDRIRLSVNHIYPIQYLMGVDIILSKL